MRASDADTLREFTLDNSQRATVNDSITETLGARYDHLSEQLSREFIDHFDPAQQAVATVTDWQAD